MENKTCLHLPSTPWSLTHPLLFTWITCHLLKGAISGRNVGGDTTNEDEYSAALERLLEGCPACTCWSSQIRCAARKGGAQSSELEEGSGRR